MSSDSTNLDHELSSASREGRYFDVLDLLQRGADPNKYTPLHWACNNNHSLCLDALVKWGGSLNRTTDGGWTALHWACAWNSMECVKILLKHHSPTDIKDKKGRTAVHLARVNENTEVAEHITHNKPLPRDPLSLYPSFEQLNQLQVDQYSQLALRFGLTEDRMKQIHKQKNPTAATLIAAKVDNIDLQWKQIVEALLEIREYKLAERVCSEQGCNALLASAFYNWIDFVEHLTNTRGFNPREPVNEAGDTVLSIACTRGHIGVIDYLMKEKDCDPAGPVNAAGDTLRSLAKSHGLSEVIKYLDNLKTSSPDRREQQKYMKIFDEMMHDTKNSILLHYQKVHFIGSSGTGKSTTRNRLVGDIINLVSLPEEKRKHRSTNLAECTQVMAVMDVSKSELTFKVAGNHDKETQMLFDYVYSHKLTDTETVHSVEESINPFQIAQPPLNEPYLTPLTLSISNPAVPTELTPTPILNSSGLVDEMSVTVVDVDKVLTRLRSIIGSGKYAKQLQNKVLLNLIDVGGQPGFLELLPFLSKGPGMFLAFFRLDKDLDELCEVFYEREEDKITPYKAIYTIRETLSQILSAIDHHVTYDTTMDEKLLSKLHIGDLASVKPVATLVGTFRDKVETMVKNKILQAKLSRDFPKALESEKKEVIEHALASLLEGHNGDYSTDQVNTDMQSTVSQWLTSDFFKKEVKEQMDQYLKKKIEAMSSITCHFDNLLFHPLDDQQFIAVDNFRGEEADIKPLREHLQTMFRSFFKDAKLRIRPAYLLLGVILRKEYDIVSMNDCIQIGRALSMEEEEVRFSVWYLDRWVGALIYHPEIEDEDGWFKENIICSPQVVFESISSLIVKSLLELHGGISSSKKFGFKPAEKKNWIEKGQFSLATVKRCHSEQSKKYVKHGKLIPLEKLVKFLKHSNLLSLITTKKEHGGQLKEEVMCFIPAILECASPEELVKSPPRDSDTPSPIKITFESGYVPVGVFCALISQLVSGGSEGILGMRWELVESCVKRNFVSFRVDAVDHIITLVAHVNCYEIRVIRQDRSIGLHDLCSYVLSTVLYLIKEINSNISPIIAFDCHCGRHKLSTSYNQLCLLISGVSTCFKCNRHQVSLTTDQEQWFAKDVTFGDDVCLEALPFADPNPSLSFKWTKRGKILLNSKVNELILEKVTQAHCKGFYACEILKIGKPYFSVYFCLRAASDTPVSDKDQLLDAVRQAIREVRSDWYSLAIELSIDYGTRKAIKSDYHCVDVCFHAMLQHWVNRTSSPPSWSALFRALKSKVVDCGGLAKEIENNISKMTSEPLGDTAILTPFDLDPQAPLSVDQHLRIVRDIVWEVRAKWSHLGLQLGISKGTLEAIQQSHHYIAGVCVTEVLENWLTQTSPLPTWTVLIEALRSPAVNHEDIASHIEALLKGSHCV